MSTLAVTHVTKRFGTAVAVNDISFEIKKNHIVGFLGPNGAGKTTTIRMIVGLSKMTSGEIVLTDHPISFGKSAQNISIGYLPERPAFYHWMTGEEYLVFVAEIFKLTSEIKANRIPELLKLVGLFDARNKKIGTYSNGMKQRLGIAQALVNDPAVLILDEPVSALDPIGRKEVFQIIETLKQTKTIFLSTHILSDVERICDDVIIINEGKIVAGSSVPALKAAYTKPVLEIDFSEDPAFLIPEINKQTWVESCEAEGTHMKIWLKGLDTFKHNEPLQFFAKQSIGLVRYGVTTPELEDLFIHLIQEQA